MKAILINAKEQTVREVTINANEGETSKVCAEIRRLVKCDMFDAMTICEFPDGDRETLWIDDEGLLKSPEVGFTIGDGRNGGSIVRVAGNALVLRTDAYGDSVSTLLSAPGLARIIRFEEYGDDNPAPQPFMSYTTL